MLVSSQKNIFCRAASTIEYMALIVLILAVFVAFQHYIVRGMSGKWKATGDSIGQGRQYDPRPFGASGEMGGTLDCYYETNIGNWVDRKQVEALGCDCTLPQGDPAFALNCITCVTNAKNPACYAFFE